MKNSVVPFSMSSQTHHLPSHYRAQSLKLGLIGCPMSINSFRLVGILLAFNALGQVAKAEQDACSSLTELQCINSSEYTFDLIELGKYRCRPAAGLCELGFTQRLDTQKRCESKPGCKCVPGNCYCPPDVACRCGGGTPPKCIENTRQQGHHAMQQELHSQKRITIRI